MLSKMKQKFGKKNFQATICILFSFAKIFHIFVTNTGKCKKVFKQI